MKKKKMFILDFSEILILRPTIGKLKLSEELDIKIPIFDVDKKSKFFHQSRIQKQKLNIKLINQGLISI
jgi:hypothetical protein